MLRTIQIGTCIQVQGILVRNLNDGRIVVSVGSREFTGSPIPMLRAAI
jgi:hypothetical protein